MRRFEHHILCQHRIEVAVWPPAAEVYYRGEPSVDPVNTQVRFDAVVLNAPTSRVAWSVHDLAGGAGPGEIDQSGLYTAPVQAGAPHVRTAVIVATAVDDPLRSATALVTLIEAAPIPQRRVTIDVFPRHAVLYFNTTSDKNRFIDASNKRQLFEAVLHHADPVAVSWTTSGPGVIAPMVPQTSSALYTSPSSGATGTIVTIKATAATNPPVSAHADVLLLSYSWPHP